MSGKFLNKISFLVVIGVFWIFNGCSNDTEPLGFVNITDQYEVKLHQQLSETGGLPALQIISIEKQDCLNSFISNHTIVSEEKIQVFIDEILVEGKCIPGSETIMEEIPLNSLNPAIQIEINLLNLIKNKGTLLSNAVEFELKLSEFDGLKISRTHINRVLPKMIWGSYSSSNIEIPIQLKHYLEGLDTNVSEKKGDYGLFYIAQDGSITIYKSNNDYTFLISTDKDFEIFKTEIQEIKQLDQSLVFQATNFDGSTVNIQ